MRAATWTDPSTFEYAPGARRFENWESFVAGRVGLATSVDYALSIGIAAIEQRVTALASRFREKLTAIDGVRVRDLGAYKCGIVTFETERETATALADRLRTNRVNVSVTYRESAQIDFADRDIEELVRASVHYYNTDDEVERFCRLLTGVLDSGSAAAGSST